MVMRWKFLGTGTSVGVPQIGCDCAVCTSADPHDKRRRTGLYVQTPRVAFLVDTPPEMRQACLEYNIRRVDAVVLTHAHMDHIAGFDDVRRFNTLNGDAPMRCYAAAQTIESMHSIFPYITDKANPLGLFRPMINYVPVTDTFTIGDVCLTPLSVPHGPPTNGYLMECNGARGAYISDCAALPDEVLAQVHGVDVMVLDMLRPKPHPTHLSLEQALDYMRLIQPRQGYFIHMSHSVPHAATEAQLPAPIHLAYDGLTLDFN